MPIFANAPTIDSETDRNTQRVVLEVVAVATIAMVVEADMHVSLGEHCTDGTYPAVDHGNVLATKGREIHVPNGGAVAYDNGPRAQVSVGQASDPVPFGLVEGLPYLVPNDLLHRAEYLHRVGMRRVVHPARRHRSISLVEKAVGG